MNRTKYYRISELSRISAVPIPTIRFYIKEGLLPPAIKAGKTSAFYSDEHLERLLFVKKQKTEERKSLATIKEELRRMPLSPVSDDIITGSSEKKDGIVSAAIVLFVKKGLGETSIDDIVNEARIGKGTFYRYFKDKDDLFIQCADAIFYEMYRTVWEEIKNEKDMARRLYKRAVAFFESYPKWIDMMNLVRHASVGNNPVFKKKFKSVLDQIIKPIARDLEVLQREKRISKDLDCLGAAYMLMGMAEYSAWRIYNEGGSAEEVMPILWDTIMNGVGKR
jgi:AcrR family transcriptional regulator